MPEAMICVTVTHTMVEKPNAAADTPLRAHGEIADKPSPAPRINRIIDKAAAAAAPARIAPHETALAWPG